MSANTHAMPPIWFKPREGFTSACVEYFGMSFDGGPIKQPLQPPVVPPGRQRTRAYPNMREARMQTGRPQKHGRGAGTSVSRRAMQRSDRLVG